uniref:Putative ovule protein n=1 Tax=Solanum chacoense TaxID=4108 RepID=A0A0V0H4F3_SOLCH
MSNLSHLIIATSAQLFFTCPNYLSSPSFILATTRALRFCFGYPHFRHLHFLNMGILNWPTLRPMQQSQLTTTL